MRKRLAFVSHFRRRREWLCNRVAVLKAQIDRPLLAAGEKMRGLRGLATSFVTRDNDFLLHAPRTCMPRRSLNL